MLRAPAHSIPALPHELCDFLPLYLGFLICKMEGRMLEPVRGGGWALPCAAPPTPTLAAPTRRACVRAALGPQPPLGSAVGLQVSFAEPTVPGAVPAPRVLDEFVLSADSPP